MNTTTTKASSAQRPRKFAREPQGEGNAAKAPSVAPPTNVKSANQSEPKPQSKAGLLVELLKREEGATLEQMVAATGWLPHTTRAALTGLKKKGHQVTSTKADGVRTYRVTEAPALSNDSPSVDGEAAA